MILYTCNKKKSVPAMHPCGRAAKALDDAGHEYEIKTVDGYKLMPWTRRGEARAEIKRLSGQSDVPILVLDGGDVVSGTGTIVDWAKANPAV